MEKKCTHCQKLRPIELYYSHPQTADRLLGKCKLCCKSYSQQRASIPEVRERIRDYEKGRSENPKRKENVARYQRRRRNKNPGKARARNAVSNALRDGRITRGPCEKCDTLNMRTQAHHDDYRSPLKVKWLCFKHHREVEHGQLTAPIQNK